MLEVKGHFADLFQYLICDISISGSVLAARLAALKDRTILIIEAGPDESAASEMPCAAKHTLSSPQAFQMETEQSDKACLSTGGKCPMSGGKSLGGSSAIGETIQLRGNRRDYDKWAAIGNEGWSYDDLLPIFKGLENVKIPELQNKSCRGYQGKMSTEFPRYLSPIADTIMQAGIQMGYPNPDSDYNCDNQCGFAQIQQCLHCGLRCSTSKAFLRPLANFTNIHFSLGSSVLKLLIKEEGHHHEHHHKIKKAYGVKFIRDGKIYEIKGSKKIILTSSAIYNPQILLLSGIGPRQELEKHKIKCIHHLPGVGENLMDHISFKGLNYKFKNQKPGQFQSQTEAGLLNINSVKCFSENGTGSLYATGGQEITAFINSRHLEFNKCSYPNFQLMFGPLDDQTDGTAIYPLLLRPKSRGCITLKNSDPSSFPLIHARYLEDPRDFEAMVRNW